ncbi:hypothetical protein [Ekhidna sp.]
MKRQKLQTYFNVSRSEAGKEKISTDVNVRSRYYPKVLHEVRDSIF